MCSADGFVNAHRWVASAALAPRSADATRRKGWRRRSWSFPDAQSVNERVSQSVSQFFHGPAPRSPLHPKLCSSKGWGCKCTRSHECCLGSVCGLRSAKHERLGTRWCTERACQSCMQSRVRTPFLVTCLVFLFGTIGFSVSDAPCHHRSHLRSPDTQWRLSTAHQRAHPRAQGHPHARPRPHRNTHPRRPSVSPRARICSSPQTLFRTSIRAARAAWLLRGG